VIKKKKAMAILVTKERLYKVLLIWKVIYMI
jgi:hypothetical protein